MEDTPNHPGNAGAGRGSKRSLRSLFGSNVLSSADRSSSVSESTTSTSTSQSACVGDGLSPIKRMRPISHQQSPSQIAAGRLLRKALRYESPVKPSVPTQSAARGKKGQWTQNEETALVQFIALHRDLQSDQDVDWPMMMPTDSYWSKAAEFIESSCSTSLRGAAAVRSKLLKLAKLHGTVEKAEIAFGITIDSYIDEVPHLPRSPPTLSLPQSLRLDLEKLTTLQKEELLQSLLPSVNLERLVTLLSTSIPKMETDSVVLLLKQTFRTLTLENSVSVLDELYSSACDSFGGGEVPTDFIQNSLTAMKKLRNKGKSNIVYRLRRCIAMTRPESHESLLPLDRMPYGLIQYQIDFFNSSHVNQVKETRDFALWRETLDSELTLRQDKLLTGPMWSGCSSMEKGDPLKARVNLACRSKRTVSRKLTQIQGITNEPVIQKKAILQFKESNPDGRFWLKADGVDIKSALQESMTGIWNGDSDLGDGKLTALRDIYVQRQNEVMGVLLSQQDEMSPKLKDIVKTLEDDNSFLSDGLEVAVKAYKTKFRAQNTPEEALKAANWEVVEFTTLLTHAQQIGSHFQKLLDRISSNTIALTAIKDDLRKVNIDYREYLKNIFKKKRQPPASHALVFLVSDERRSKKPYAGPVMYIPYHSIRDQYIRDFTKNIKEEMKACGLTVVGTVTDGEFCSLRSQGETRPLHLWQLIHDAKIAVSKMKRNTLVDILTPTNVVVDGVPVMIKENEVIPTTLKLQLYDLVHVQNLPLKTAIAQVRKQLVPNGYEAHPWKPNNAEAFSEELRTVLATMYFRNSVAYWAERGVDFRTYLYIPEIDPTTGTVHHERADHCHLLKRIANHTRQGRYQQLELLGFDKAMENPTTGLTYAALVGKRKQSVTDSEKLLS